MSSLVENRETEKDSFRIGNISSMEEIMGNEPSIKQKFIAECLGTSFISIHRMWGWGLLRFPNKSNVSCWRFGSHRISLCFSEGIRSPF